MLTQFYVSIWHQSLGRNELTKIGSCVALYIPFASIYFQATEDDHPDKKQLRASIGAMTDVATAINEYKRRKDLGE